MDDKITAKIQEIVETIGESNSILYDAQFGYAAVDIQQFLDTPEKPIKKTKEKVGYLGLKKEQPLNIQEKELLNLLETVKEQIEEAMDLLS